MTMPMLKIPADKNSELFYDANRLSVSFRARQEGRRTKETVDKVLHVVVQAFGGVVEDRIFRPGTVIHVGTGRRNTFRIAAPNLPDRHPLIHYEADGSVTLSFNREFTGVLQNEERLEPLPSTKGIEPQTIRLKRGARGCLQHGTILFYFEEIADPEKAPPVVIWQLLRDRYMGRWLVLSYALHLLILLLAVLIPASPKVVTLEELSPRFQKLIIQPTQIKPYVPKVVMSPGLSRGKVGQEGEGARAPGREGRRGKGVPGTNKAMSRSDINKKGVLDVFSSKGNRGALAELLGGGSAIPGDADSKVGALSPRYGLPGEREYRSGKGLQGTGTGGGGLSTSIGQGLGTKGYGGGAKGTGLADFGTGRSSTAVSASIDDEEVFIMGSLPREVIAKVIQDNLGKFRYCYERQVQIEPKIRGKIVTNFIIGLEGRVTTAKVKSSSMQSPPVESCVVNVLRLLKFPKPGGGIVEVSYPFLFRVAG